MVPIAGTRAFLAAAGSRDKTLIEVPGAFHALPLEPEGEALVERAAQWMRQRTQGRGD
jgi:alpha-beta hydrolase superfamily lysophospholipase